MIPALRATGWLVLIAAIVAAIAGLGALGARHPVPAMCAIIGLFAAGIWYLLYTYEQDRRAANRRAGRRR